MPWISLRLRAVPFRRARLHNLYGLKGVPLSHFLANFVKFSHLTFLTHGSRLCLRAQIVSEDPLNPPEMATAGRLLMELRVVPHSCLGLTPFFLQGLVTTLKSCLDLEPLISPLSPDTTSFSSFFCCVLKPSGLPGAVDLVSLSTHSYSVSPPP